MIYPTRVAHGYIAALLVGLIILHLLAALYHQFVRKDGLFRRMFFGRRVSTEVAAMPERQPSRVKRRRAEKLDRKQGRQVE